MEIVYADKTVTEVVMKQGFQLIKVKSNENETEEPVLEGAGFKCYLTSALKHHEDGSADYENSTPVVIGQNGETELFTDAQGYMSTIPIPYGTYTVIESVTPHNMTTIKPFTVVIDHDDRVNLQPWRIFDDREFMAKLRIVKMDADTGRSVLIANTEFRIWDVANAEYVVQYTTYPDTVSHASFFTNASGELTLPQKLPLGEYIVEEVHAPEGYALNSNGVHVLVDTDTAYQINEETQDAVITVRYEDVPIHGEVELTKTGDFLVSYGGMDGDFIYESRPLAGAAFSIYAAEDILTADMHVDESGERLRLFYAGDLVQTVTTGALGTAKFRELPCGKYEIRETNAPEGYVRSVIVSEAAFSYIDELTPVITGAAVCHNEHQHVSITVYKQDDKSQRPLPGAQFALYAKADIRNADGELLVTGGSLVEMATSDRSGMVAFSKDLPLGEYYAREIFAPTGYVCDTDRMITLSALYAGQEYPAATAAAIVTNTAIRTNRPPTPSTPTPEISTGTSVEVSKVDFTTGTELPGAKLTLLDENGDVVEEWTSTETPHMVSGLERGKRYTLRELIAPAGYFVAEEIVFTAGDETKVVMRDQRQTFGVMVLKTAKDTKLPLKGAAFGLYTQKPVKNAMGYDMVSGGALIEMAVTDQLGCARFSSMLSAGDYYIKELAAPEGYALSDAVYPVTLTGSVDDAEVRPVQKMVTVKVADQPILVDISKTDITGEEELVGAVLSIYDSDGNMVEKWLTNGTPKRIRGLKPGRYILREETAPWGFLIANEIEFTVRDTAKVQKVTMKDEMICGRIRIVKTDADTGKPLAGTEFEIRDKDGNVIETLVTDEDGKAVSGRLAIGVLDYSDQCDRSAKKAVYYVVETKAAKGYLLDSTPHKVTFSYDSTKGTPSVVYHYLTLENRKLPQTGGNYEPAVFTAAGAVLILLGGSLFIFGRKKNRKTKK